MSEKTGDTLWQPDGSGGVQPQRVGGGSRSSQLPQDLIGEAPQDGGLYLRGNAGWELYTPPAPGVDEAPQDGVQYTRQNGQWVNVNPIRSGLVVQGPTTVQGAFDISEPGQSRLVFTNQPSYTGVGGKVVFDDEVYAFTDPTDQSGIGSRGFNDDRYAASTETWYRLNNSFTADNAVQVFLSSGVKEDYGDRLFTRSSDKLYPTRSGTWMYLVTVSFDDLQDAATRGNRMLAIRRNGATLFRNNVNDNESSAMTVTATVVLRQSDYLSVEMRVGHNTNADVYLQATNLGPAA